MTRVGFIFDVGGVDRDTASLFFRRLVNFGVIRELGTSLIGKDLGDGSGQGRLPMINVTFRLCEKSIVAKDFGRVYYLWSQCSYEALHGKTWR